MSQPCLSSLCFLSPGLQPLSAHTLMTYPSATRHCFIGWHPLVSSFTAASAACASFLLDSSLCLHTYSRHIRQPHVSASFEWLHPSLPPQQSLLPSSWTPVFACTHTHEISVSHTPLLHWMATSHSAPSLPPWQPVLPSSWTPVFACTHTHDIPVSHVSYPSLDGCLSSLCLLCHCL